MSVLKEKNCVIGITGGIAAYKICGLVSLLKKSGANVQVIMTENACRFITPLSLETLSGNPVICDMFENKSHWDVEHISVAKKADVFLIAPATANFIAKYATGVADDFLTTTVLAVKKGCPVLVAPAMNTAMYNHETVKQNIETLKKRGVKIVSPDSGVLACGDVGEGRMAQPEVLFEYLESTFETKNDFKGKTVLVTAGATAEDIDGVRFISNYSSGKMGIAIADNAFERGAKVILIQGKVKVKPENNIEIINADTTVKMFDAVMKNLSRADAVIMAAAPADYRAETDIKSKLKGDSITLKLVKNPDIAKSVGEVKKDKKLVIFCAETGNPVESAKEKLQKKNADFVVANDVTKEGAGFDVDTNIVSFIDKSGKIENLPILSKKEVAKKILDKLGQL